MKNRYVAIAIFFMAFTISSANGETWSGSTRLKQIYPYADGLIFLSDYSNTSLSTCDSGTRFQISKNHENYDVMVSALIAAFMADKAISFNIGNQTATCMPTINRFRVVK